jgi:hypothetical protein
VVFPLRSLASEGARGVLFLNKLYSSVAAGRWCPGAKNVPFNVKDLFNVAQAGRRKMGFLFASSLKDALLSVSKQINAQILELGTRESRLLI